MTHSLRGSVLTCTMMLSAVVASCATQAPSPAAPTPPPQSLALPDPLTSNCIVLLGGGGTLTTNETVNDKWFAIDGVVERALMSDLNADGYRVHDYIVNTRNTEVRLAGLILQERNTGCGQVLEVTHELPAQQFGFLVQVGYLHPASSSARSVTFVGQYEREYTYPLTTEVMQNLSLSGVGKNMATDLERTGVLRK